MTMNEHPLKLMVVLLVVIFVPFVYVDVWWPVFV